MLWFRDGRRHAMVAKVAQEKGLLFHVYLALQTHDVLNSNVSASYNTLSVIVRTWAARTLLGKFFAQILSSRMRVSLNCCPEYT